MVITLNGIMKELTKSVPVNDLLQEHRINQNNCIVEINGEVINPNEYHKEIKEGDVVELIRFIGGG